MDLFVRKVKCRHLLFRSAIANYFGKFAAVGVRNHQLGSSEIRSRFATCRIAPVAEGAVPLKQRAPRVGDVSSAVGTPTAISLVERNRITAQLLLGELGEIGHTALARANKTFNLLRRKFAVHIEQRREPRKDALALVSVTYRTVLGIGLRAR